MLDKEKYRKEYNDIIEDILDSIICSLPTIEQMGAQILAQSDRRSLKTFGLDLREQIIEQSITLIDRCKDLLHQLSEEYTPAEGCVFAEEPAQTTMEKTKRDLSIIKEKMITLGHYL